MPELVVDFITSLDGYASARTGRVGGVWRGRSTWPGWVRTPKGITWF